VNLWQEDRFSSGMTRAVRTLIISTVAAFVLQQLVDRLAGSHFSGLFGLSVTGLRSGYLWQPVTYLFVHAGFFHIFLNMLGLYFIGPETERAIGSKHFYLLYFLSGVLGGIGWILISNTPWALCVGASGALFGVLGAFGALFPDRPITVLVFYVLPITMRAWVLVLSLGLAELAFLLGSPAGGIAYAAHLAGGVAGYVYALVLFRKSPGRVGTSWLRRLRLKREVSQVDVDRVLDKIAREGIGSLTRQERDMLARASHERQGGTVPGG
jgi:membrane associated rhomboid family serine protease